MNHKYEIAPIYDIEEMFFNQIIQVRSIRKPVEGRLIQIRKGIGAFGSNIYMIRHKNGDLSTAENVSIHPLKKGFEDSELKEWLDFEDSEQVEYTINRKYPEKGFIIEKPTDPNQNRVNSFSLFVYSNDT